MWGYGPGMTVDLQNNPQVVMRDPAGREFHLSHGDLIGRLASAALPLDDGRVSEAHAMISLREGQLQILALRGGLLVEGDRVTHRPLSPGLVLTLAPGVDLTVVEVWVPHSVLGVEGDRGAVQALPRQILPGVASLFADPHLRLVRGWRDGAPAYVWNDGERFKLRTASGVVELRAGDGFEVAGQRVKVVEIPMVEAGESATRQRLDAPLRIVAHYDSVQVHRDGRTALVLGGRPARLIGELVGCDCPVGWEALAGALWPEITDDAALLRSRLDVVLSRIRQKLRAAGIRSNLVSTDGAGTVALVLDRHDVVEDRS